MNNAIAPTKNIFHIHEQLVMPPYVLRDNVECPPTHENVQGNLKLNYGLLTYVYDIMHLQIGTHY